MAKVPPYSTDFEEHPAEYKNVYHDHDDCPDGRLILPHHRRSGTGDKNGAGGAEGRAGILPLIPIGRLGEPEEIARCVVFLASDDAGLITGSTISANGGQYMV